MRQNLERAIALEERAETFIPKIENAKAGTKRKKKIKHLLELDQKDKNLFLVCLFDRCVDVQKFTPSTSIYSMTRDWKNNCTDISISKNLDEEKLKNCQISGQPDYVIDLASIPRPDFYTPGFGLNELKKRWSQIREFELKKSRIKEKTFQSDIEVIKNMYDN